MAEWEYTIQDPEGPHTQPASKLVMKTTKFNSDIRAGLYQNSADAKNILEVTVLDAGRNDKILIRVSDEDEEEALEAIKQVLAQENNLNPRRFQIEV